MQSDAVRQRLVVASRQESRLALDCRVAATVAKTSPGDLMAQVSNYSYTERKRIRKSFGTRDAVLDVPYLLQMQKDAYTLFLQAGVASNKRVHEGLQAAFESAFPIVSHNGFVEILAAQQTLARCRPGSR